MPLSIIPFVINVMIGISLWGSDLSTTIKVALTIILVAKFMMYFYSVLMTDSDMSRNIGLAVCALIDIGGIVYTAINGIWTSTVLFAAILLLLVVWRVVTSFDFSRKGDKKE